jgi:hypothetical protein
VRGTLHLDQLLSSFAIRVAPPGLLERARESLLLMDSEARDEMEDWDIDWKAVWSGRIEVDDARLVLRRVDMEISGHEEGDYKDIDIAFAVDAARRNANG